jgi:hypothetical protein
MIYQPEKPSIRNTDTKHTPSSEKSNHSRELKFLFFMAVLLVLASCGSAPQPVEATYTPDFPPMSVYPTLPSKISEFSAEQMSSLLDNIENNEQIPGKVREYALSPSGEKMVFIIERTDGLFVGSVDLETKQINYVPQGIKKLEHLQKEKWSEDEAVYVFESQGHTLFYVLKLSAIYVDSFPTPLPGPRK